MKTNLKNLMALNPVFKDFDMEGANITTLVELIAYMGSLNTYYMNMIAKNQFLPTSNIYEPTHMLSQLGGYNPQGYISAQSTLQISISTSAASAALSLETSGATLIINEWSKITCSTGITNPDTGEAIEFITMNPTTSYPVSAVTSLAASASYTLDPPIVVREGKIVRYDYSGTDISSNKIYLPFETFDYDDDLSDEYVPIQLFVNDVKWNRIADWYEDITETDEKVYMLKYDKYKRYYIEFSDTRQVPESIDTLTIYMLISSGLYGNIAAGLIDTPASDLIVTSGGRTLSASCYTVTNSASSFGGASPETIEEIKNGTIGVLHSQYRNVTKNDYITHLESRSDVVKANVWGEQDLVPSGGSPQNYNKVYVSVIPDTWDTGTLVTVSAGTTDSPLISAAPITYPIPSAGYLHTLTDYLAARRMLTVEEIFIAPELIYFYFDIGLKLKVNYTYVDVYTDVLNKLKYYFSSENRSFADVISFTDIAEYILDSSIESTTDTFSNVKGLRSLIVRDIGVRNYAGSVTVNPYDSTTYPRYADNTSVSGYDNQLRRIELSYVQFPMLYPASCNFILEN